MFRKNSPKDERLPAKTSYRRSAALLLCTAAAAVLFAGGCGSQNDTAHTADSAITEEIAAAEEQSSETASEDDAAREETAQGSDSQDTESGMADSGSTGSDAADSGKTNTDNADSDTAETDTADSDDTGSESGKQPASDLTYKQKLNYIQNHKKQYPKRYRQLAKQYPETIDFVYNYPELHGQEYEIDLSAEAASASIPLLLQWDERWGYEAYGDGDIGYTGCGPTCLSMAALYLTGNAKYTPLYIAEYADANGYYSEGSGTLWLLMTQGAKAFGMTATEVDVEEDSLKRLVKNGQPVICSVGKGDFTESGHFIVLTGYKNGKFTLHDPNSIENSEKSWSYKRLAKQIRTAWSYRASGSSADNGAAG